MKFLVENILSTMLLFLNKSASHYEYTLCFGHAVSMETRLHHTVIVSTAQTLRHTQCCFSKFFQNLNRLQICLLSSKWDGLEQIVVLMKYLYECEG